MNYDHRLHTLQYHAHRLHACTGHRLAGVTGNRPGSHRRVVRTGRPCSHRASPSIEPLRRLRESKGDETAHRSSCLPSTRRQRWIAVNESIRDVTDATVRAVQRSTATRCAAAAGAAGSAALYRLVMLTVMKASVDRSDGRCSWSHV